MKLIHTAITLLLIALSIFILIWGKSLLIPFVIALAIWYIIVILTGEFQKIKYKKWVMPYWLAFIFAIITSSGVLYGIFSLINANVNDVIDTAPAYQIKLEALLSQAINTLGITKVDIVDYLFKQVDFANIFTNVAVTVTTLAGYLGAIIIYVVFLFIEHRYFERKLEALTQNNEKYKRTQVIMHKISQQIKKYIRSKTIMSFLTGFLSYIVLISVGVDFAEFWALLIFVLNYIPYIGSIVAIMFPIFFSLVQFDSLIPFFIVAILLIAIQQAIGGFIEYKIEGRELNLSPIVIIISLALWGKIWGLTGMFLGIPIMVIINIILANFPTTRPIAILLSEKGDINME